MGGRGRITVTPEGGVAALVAVVRSVGVGVTDPNLRGPWAAGGRRWAPRFPAYLRDLRPDVGVSSAAMTLLEEDAMTMSAEGGAQRTYNADVPNFQLRGGTTHEWRVASEHHPWHLHVVHFQIVGGGCGWYEPGEYGVACIRSGGGSGG